jgi:tetrahydrodipicolinate N-succinyltransferase
MLNAAGVVGIALAAAEAGVAVGDGAVVAVASVVAAASEVVVGDSGGKVHAQKDQEIHDLKADKNRQLADKTVTKMFQKYPVPKK